MSIVKADGETWYDISDEAYRIYTYANGFELRIDDPEGLQVTAQPDGGHSHRIRTSGEGENYYIAAGWLAVRWDGEFLF